VEDLTYNRTEEPGGTFIVSVHPEMAIFRNICVGLRISILKILNVWMPVPMESGWLKFSPAFLSRSFQREILQKLSYFWMDTSSV